MVTLDIRHRTTYRYNRQVSLLPHRLMLRPRENRDIRLISFDLEIVPAALISWTQDIFGNTIAIATFSLLTDTLTITSQARLILDAIPWPVFDISASAICYPFEYTVDEWADLGQLTTEQYRDDQTGGLRAWAEAFIRSNPTDTLSLLKDLNTGISSSISYQSRENEGTQSPTETLRRGWGTCRDFAVLFVEAARSLGIGARIVSGYLFDPTNDAIGSSGPGSTHAWAEVYVPGAGWIMFDPTNRSMGGGNLIPVAVARRIEQTMPVVGNFTGPGDAFIDMSVEVLVSSS